MDAELGEKRSRMARISQPGVMKHVVIRLVTNWVFLFVVAVFLIPCYWSISHYEVGPFGKDVAGPPHGRLQTIAPSTESPSASLSHHVDGELGPTLSESIAVVETATGVGGAQDEHVDHVKDEPKAPEEPIQPPPEEPKAPEEPIQPPSEEPKAHPGKPKGYQPKKPVPPRIYDLSNSPDSPDIPNPNPGTHRLVILIPIDSPDPNLCKLVFSAMANGYPNPILINWGGEGDRLYGGYDKSHIAKIVGSVEYMDEMMRDTAHPDDRIRDDDLVMIVDGLDLWWQLPPEVLIKRYHDINRKANERLAKQWGMPGRMPMEQTIVSAAQKRCWPAAGRGINMHCESLPESPERKDLYGPLTDTKEGGPRKQRSYTINGGTHIGPARDLRRFLRAAADRVSRIASHHPEVNTDQGPVGEVFGEQEIVRTWLREQPNRGEKSYFENPAMKIMLENFEYFFGLDYGQQIAIATNFKEDDGALIKLNDRPSLDHMAAQREINPVRLTGVPADLLDVQTPLRKYLPDQETGDWGNLTLYADFYAEAVPVIVHYNGDSPEYKMRRITWWDSTWYFPYLRKLVNKYLERPVELPILGEYVFGEHKVQYQALPSELIKRKPRRWVKEMATVGLPVLEFEDICKDKADQPKWYDEIFRDGLGPV
ncbi:hypothetical protein B0T10DRAFT_476763 [Thelonectria olida]|uniref:Uncharacterized protein n=1 Tax=Thelonectria olida TaxID=1576542 RepID=A0A9P8WH55_9HYPO|nr:hypothetical protein B0T10DRAFT_476763 [Thelonectria olida]